jgi:hypothetical protein
MALWAIAGVAIPVIVHLWNDRRGRVLRIGSVALLAGVSRRAAWSPRLSQLWLLLLRCLLMIALAVFLAGPYRVRVPRGGIDWLLVDTVGLPGNWRADTVLKAGYEWHVLDGSENYYDALRRMDRAAPRGVRFLVVTPDLVSRFHGTRPVTDRSIDWKLYPPADSVMNWTEAVWRVSADSILVLRGVSRNGGTEYKRERMAFRGVAFEGVVVDTTAMKLAVAGGRQERDFMRAALKALSGYTGRMVRVVDSAVAGPGITVPGVRLRGAGGLGAGVSAVGGPVGRTIQWRPEWSDAAWDGRLPVLLGDLLFARSGNVVMDRRGIDPNQLSQASFRGRNGKDAGQRDLAAGGSAVARERVDLRPTVWVIVLLLFVMERIKSFREERRRT